MRALPAGRHFFQEGSDGYEGRLAAAPCGIGAYRIATRVIVQAVSADDIGAIRPRHGQGDVVSGGHSFAASHLRDGAVLLDVSRMEPYASIDADGRAVVGPGRRQRARAWPAGQGLFFPGGHCRSLSRVICCRADTAGTAGSTARRASVLA